ncbi:uncharacterized protein LOC124358022 isoform X1 [Homalodisca vitripennis]|uniref:uncharacterized protein LOC124358022 isoform X1 n=1 Tax=Homalodisca vitripennis TaxID=197043 RepID=UPI001EEBA853|nr:uncharacterized protein LOC124358022 isoform X1 [Homalodisca vitripennis]
MYPKLPIWNNPKEVRYTRRYYMDMYKRLTGETDDDYYRRLMYQGPNESNEDYVRRMQVIQAVLPKLDLWTSRKYLMYTAKYFTFLYQKKEGEDKQTFDSRIFARQPGESKTDYVSRIDIMRILFNTELEHVFDNPDFLNYTKDYYTQKYGQKTGESIDDYVTRTFTEDPEESDYEYLNRVKVVNALFPDLEVWTDKSKIDSTKHFYELLYQKQPEQSDDDYYKNIFAQKPGESDETYKDRIEIFQLTYPELPVWDNPEYLVYTKKFYQLEYTKPKGQSDDQFYKPIFQKKVGETNAHYLNRLTNFFLVDPENPAWNDVEYLKYTKPYFSLLFAQKPDESVAAWANRLLKQYPEESDTEYKNRMNIVQAVVSKDVWDKITSLKAAEKDKLVSNAGVTYIDDEIKSTEDKDVNAAKVLAKRAYEGYYEYMARILEPDSDETEDSHKERLEWIKNNMPTVAQTDLYRYYTDGTYKTKADYPLLSALRHKAVHQLEKEGKTLKDVPILSKRSQVVLASQQPWETRRQYYEKLYKQNDEESLEDYYARILSQKPHESTNHFIKRLATLKKVFPTLAVWKNNEYLKYVGGVRADQVDNYKKASAEKNDDESLESDSIGDDN